jgi:hypothetical protein
MLEIRVRSQNGAPDSISQTNLIFGTGGNLLEKCTISVSVRFRTNLVLTPLNLEILWTRCIIVPHGHSHLLGECTNAPVGYPHVAAHATAVALGAAPAALAFTR